ncbi:MAG: putative GntR-family transcriptional regulator [Subtercola sp.]|nr:putative GntR-family transcriptional regulator [Subtercola sp.]
MRSLNVTRASVREALGMLTAEGVVSRSPRRGTSPIQSTVHVTANDVLSFDRFGTEISDRIKEVPKSRQVYLADLVIGAKLGLIDTDRVRVDESVITVDGEPVGLRSIYTPVEILHGDGSQVHGIHLLVKLESLGISVAQVDSTFEAISADRTTALSLDVPEGTPILLREMIHYSSAGIPVCLSTIRHRSDRSIVHTSRQIRTALATVK